MNISVNISMNSTNNSNFSQKSLINKNIYRCKISTNGIDSLAIFFIVREIDLVGLLLSRLYNMRSIKDFKCLSFLQSR